MFSKRARGFDRWVLYAVTTIGLAGAPVSALQAAQQDEPTGTPTTSVSARLEVTATRIPEDVEIVPASITIIQGSELEARGVRDLPSALALVGGVSIAPGGDGGPAASVPEIWGLREFDAFLLVVDGVPWGGAFNPALSSLDFYNLERIEILRGAAPVLYGATSFVGVIHLIHRAAGEGNRNAQLFAGNYGTFGAAYSSPLPASGRFRQSLSVDGERRGFKDDDTGYDKGHLLYRSTFDTAGGKLRFDIDGSTVRQSPASPHVRTGTVLTPLIPLDANHNPRDAKIDENRIHLVGGYDSRLAGAEWSTTLALTHSTRDTVRGFLTGVGASRPNAIGYEQDLEVSDLYLDSHLAWGLGSKARLVAGFDHLYGRAEAEAETFAYSVNLNGSGKPASGGQARQMGFEVEDERNFSGLYGQAEWDPTSRLHLQLGLRLNRTAEDREAGEEELAGGEGEEEEEEGKQSRTENELSGVVGGSLLLWGHDQDGVWLFADYRDTYKPAAIDFGPEAEAEILEPETATSVEAGIKSHFSHTDVEVTAFQMDFENLVTATTVNGLPALINAGETRFKGIELEGKVELPHDLKGQLSYAWHDSKFRDFVQAFDEVPTQLAGKRFEMSAKELASAGLSYMPQDGLNAYALMNYVGDRYLNKRNTALADAYTTFSAGLGYHFAHWTVRLDGENLNDERPPVAESELGDAQYYRLPARTARLTLAKSF